MCFKIDFNKINISKSEFMNKLKKKGIITQVHYIPVYLHPFYRNKKGSQKKLKNTESMNKPYRFLFIMT